MEGRGLIYLNDVLIGEGKGLAMEEVRVEPVSESIGRLLPSFPKSYSGTLKIGSTNQDWYRQQLNFKRFGTYAPTKRQRELYAKRKKKSRHKKRR